MHSQCRPRRVYIWMCVCIYAFGLLFFSRSVKKEIGKDREK